MVEIGTHVLNYMYDSWGHALSELEPSEGWNLPYGQDINK
jgi:hypothetical protein